VSATEEIDPAIKAEFLAFMDYSRMVLPDEGTMALMLGALTSYPIWAMGMMDNQDSHVDASYPEDSAEMVQAIMLQMTTKDKAKIFSWLASVAEWPDDQDSDIPPEYRERHYARLILEWLERQPGYNGIERVKLNYPIVNHYRGKGGHPVEIRWIRRNATVFDGWTELPERPEPFNCTADWRPVKRSSRSDGR
jgi:hypothetical protein